jgi:hypothetical protein
MVDYIRIFWRDKSKFEHFVCQQENFQEVDTLFGLHTGQIKYPYKASFNSMDVRVTEKYGFVVNSIHKAFNDKSGGKPHNHNDFSYENLCEMIDYINNKIIDVDKAKITQFEFGINIETPIPAEEIIRNNILMHKYKGANHNRLFNGRGELKQFDYHNYLIKVYDKAKQYNLNKNLLRFEIRFQKAKEFQKIGIFKLNDLKDKFKLRKLFQILLKKFEELVIIDDYEESEITNSDLSKLNRYKNPHYWETRVSMYSNTTKMRYVREFKALLVKYNLLKTKQGIRGLMIQKYLQLINF